MDSVEAWRFLVPVIGAVAGLLGAFAGLLLALPKMFRWLGERVLLPGINVHQQLIEALQLNPKAYVPRPEVETRLAGLDERQAGLTARVRADADYARKNVDLLRNEVQAVKLTLAAMPALLAREVRQATEEQTRLLTALLRPDAPGGKP